MATHCSVLAWEIPWTEEPGGLQSTGSQELDTPGRLKKMLVTNEQPHEFHMRKRHNEILELLSSS